MIRPIEGYFIVTKNDHIFEVKGLLHPKDRLIAYLRYIPCADGNRHASDGRHYRKIYSLVEREEYLRSLEMDSLWFDDTLGRIVQTVPNTQIAYIQNPVDSLRQMRDMGRHVDTLQDATIRLASVLVERSGISWSDIGITGSQLVGLATEKSDIDLVVYGESAGQKIYSMLEQDFDSVPELIRYSDKSLDRHVDFRWGKENSKWTVLKEIEREKSLQGLIDSFEFFIRLVKLPDDLCYSYGEVLFKNCEIVTTVCTIIDASNRMFTPCRYDVDCEMIPDLKEIVSFRGRFTEQSIEDTRVEVRGRLELVISKDDMRYKRLVLGESPKDYMIPSKVFKG